MKNNVFKYITVSEEDKECGVYLYVAGEATIEKNTEYPPKGHPSSYSFNLNTGRTLYEYQLNYITEGFGIFENKYGKFRVTPGTIIILFPGEWHRYRPLKSTGWKEHYIGFNGVLASKLLKSEFFKLEQPIIRVNFHKELLDIFYRILEQIMNEKAGYQLVASGLTIAYIGQIIATIKNKEFEGKDIEQKIKQACVIMRDNLNRNINAFAIARELSIGYSYFRKMFKKYTGVSPLQYHLQLRIKQAEDMLSSTNKSMKEIAYDLGFSSFFYFSRLFKQKTGVNPTDFRKVKKM
jgi:AraC-like DNA-binding protein